MFVKNLTPGTRFVTPASAYTTEYVCESVRVQDGYAYVTYSIPGTDIRNGFPTRPLSTVTVIEDES